MELLDRIIFKNKCDRCKDDGISCREYRIPMVGMGTTGVRIEGKMVFRVSRGISDCEIITGESNKEEVIARIKKNAKILQDLALNSSEKRISNY